MISRMTDPDTQVVDEELTQVLIECYHAGSMSQGGKTIHAGTVEKYAARINQLLGQEKIKADTAARIDVMKEARLQMLHIDHGRLSFSVALMNITKAIDQYEAELVQYNQNPKERSE